MSKKVIGIIPARYGSTRFPGKPLVSILGKTLLQRTYENATQAALIDDLLVATDHPDIFDHVIKFGGRAVMTSPHCPNGTDRLAEVLAANPDFMKAKVIVNIQGDEPCVDPRAIDKVAQLLIEDQTAPMSTLVTRLNTYEEASNPSTVKCVIDQKQNALYFSRTLIPFSRKTNFDLNHIYYRHIGLYAYQPSFLLIYQQLSSTPLQLMEDLEQLKVLEHGYRIKVAVVDYKNIDVNDPEDISKVEQWILCKQNTSL